MSAILSTNSQQASVPWAESTKVSMKNSADAFVDGVRPHVTTLSKAACNGAIGTAVNAAGAAIIASSATSPHGAILAVAVGTGIPTVTTAIQQCTDPLVDACVEKTVPVSKRCIHGSINRSVDLSARCFSVSQ